MLQPRRDFLKWATAGLGAVGAVRLAPWILEAEAVPSPEVELLTEIRDVLKAK
jgi:hypothetical protein